MRLKECDMPRLHVGPVWRYSTFLQCSWCVSSVHVQLHRGVDWRLLRRAETHRKQLDYSVEPVDAEEQQVSSAYGHGHAQCWLCVAFIVRYSIDEAFTVKFQLEFLRSWIVFNASSCIGERKSGEVRGYKEPHSAFCSECSLRI